MNTAVVFLKQLGDLVLLEPALARCRGPGGPPVTLVARPGLEPVLSLMENVRAPRAPHTPFDAVLAFEPGLPAAWAARRLPARSRRLTLHKPAARRWHHRALYSDIRIVPYRDLYRARYYWECVGAPAAAPFRPPHLQPPPDDWRPAATPPGGYLLLHPTAAWQRKCYPPQQWTAAIKPLLPTLGPPILLTSGPAPWERELAGALAGALGPAALNLAGKTSLRDFLYLASRARAVLTVDGSASHLARAFQRPSLTLFGPTKKSHWFLDQPPHLALAASDFAPGRDRPPVELIPPHAVSELIARLGHAYPP